MYVYSALLLVVLFLAVVDVGGCLILDKNRPSHSHPHQFVSFSAVKDSVIKVSKVSL